MRVLFLLLVLMIFVSPAFASDPQDEPSWWTTVFKDAIEIFWNWLVESVDTIFSSLLDYLFAAIPEQFQADAEPFRQYIEVANVWIPLDYGISLLGAYYTFLAVFVVIKFVLKLIPTVG
jgi:hypothetical protein